jgi:hypothetical protein
LTAGDLFSQHLNALIVERWETTQKSVEDTAKCPHVDTLRVSLILDDFRCSVSDCAARCHRRVIPDDLGKAEIGNLDYTDAAGTDTPDKLAFVFLVLVSGRLWLRVLGRNERRGVEEKVLGFDITSTC